jgi:regulation of enolase protein 1 (concanavalin A-like superfamily)
MNPTPFRSAVPLAFLALAIFAFPGAGGRAEAASTEFADDFRGKLDPGWSILRERKDAWRVVDGALEVRVLPGNMWGGANDAKNTFVRPVPDPAQGPVEVSVRVENRPTEQYEQVDLVWYYADSHQVKIGQELVDGKLSIVMGREEGDRTRTIAIIPLDSAVVDVRLRVRGSRIIGAFRTPTMSDWKEAGSCDVPAQGAPKVSLQVYQGTTQVERWARISQFRLRQGE